MILKFPDIETLRLALHTGAVPAAVSQTPVSAAFTEKEVWVDTAQSFSRSAANDLKKLGVTGAKSAPVKLDVVAKCWPQLLPLVGDTRMPERLEQTPVLFDMATGAELSRLIVEVLRLGNDRQSYRWLESAEGNGRALLRVVGPPYYSLLRAIDKQGG